VNVVTQQRRYRTLALYVVIAVVLWVVARGPLPFVPSWWAAGAENRGDPLKRRHRIADGFVLTGHLLGKSREELITLLGAPPKTDYFSDWEMVYWLGAERGFMSIDSEWLVIRLNASGKAVEARIVRD
jgi:hypothetical protein